MINLEQVGAGKNWVLKKSLNEDSLMDRALISSFETTRVKYKIQKFFQGYMNDEKIYSWPKLSIPSPASADKRCSTVDILTSLFESDVCNLVSLTLSNEALMGLL